MHGDAVDGLHDDHAAAGGDGFEGALALAVDEGEAVVVGVLGTVGNVTNIDVDAGLHDFFAEIEEAGVVGVPSHEPAKESEVGALGLVGGDEGAVGIVFDDDAVELAIHEVEGEAANAEGCGAVRTGGAAHDGTEDIVEDAGWSGVFGSHFVESSICRADWNVKFARLFELFKWSE